MLRAVQARASVLTAAQCASYDESKKLWLYMVGGGENFTTHLGASMITGVITTTATGPVDVIKTNMFVGAPLECLGAVSAHSPACSDSCTCS